MYVTIIDVAGITKQVSCPAVVYKNCAITVGIVGGKYTYYDRQPQCGQETEENLVTLCVQNAIDVMKQEKELTTTTGSSVSVG